MSKNSLFNTISEVTSKETNIPGVEKLSLLTHNQGKKYFLFELPKKDTTIGPYILLSHHLSVYEGAISKLDLQSQYHYTAYFADSSKNIYRLHIYFNAYDEYVCEPMLSVKEENNYKDIESIDHQEAFKILAHFYIYKLTAHLRVTQKKLVSDLQQELDYLQKEATQLSTDFIKNKTAYLLVLDKQTVLLERLGCHSNPKHLRGIKAHISFIQGMKKAVSEKSETPEILEIKLGNHNQIIPTQPNSQTQKSSKKKKILTQKSKVNPDVVVVNGRTIQKKTGLSKKIENLKIEFSVLKEDKSDNKFETIDTFWFNLFELEVEVEKGIYDADLRDRHDLQTLKKNLETFGFTLLQQALIGEDFKQAEKLSQFYPLISENILKVALRLDKSELIDFLLKNNISRLSDANSIADYYFKQSSISKEALNSFNAFVKNGLSLMSIDDKTGLPYAAILLLNPKHPLYPVLEKNADSTIKNPVFYKQLNEVLKVIINAPSCSKENIILIKELITENSNTIKQIISIKSSSHSKIINKLSDDFLDHTKKTLGINLLDQVKADPIIQKLYNEFSKRKEKLLKQVPPNMKNAITLAMKDIFELTKKSIDSIVDLDAIPSHEDIQIMLRDELLKTFEILDLHDELFDIGDKLKKKINAETPSREAKRLLHRQDEILKILDKHYKNIIANLNSGITQNNEVKKELNKALVEVETLLKKGLDNFRNKMETVIATVFQEKLDELKDTALKEIVNNNKGKIQQAALEVLGSLFQSHQKEFLKPLPKPLSSQEEKKKSYHFS